MIRPGKIALETVSAIMVLASGYPLIHYSKLKEIQAPQIEIANPIVFFLVALGLYLLMFAAQRYTNLIRINDNAIDRNNDYVQELLSDLALWLKVGITSLFAFSALKNYFLAIGTVNVEKYCFIGRIIIPVILLGIVIYYWNKMRRVSLDEKYHR